MKLSPVFSNKVPVLKTAALLFFLVFSLGLLQSGCGKNPGGLQDETAVAESRVSYRGKMIKKSHRLKTISLEIVDSGQPQVVEIGFDRMTRGIDHAVSGKNVIIACKVVKGKIYAQSIRPDLDGYASGVSEISPQKVKKMIGIDEEMLLIDARSNKSFLQAHIPTAVSIPECEIRNSPMLPEKKEQLLIFYCGGPLCGMSTLASAAAVQQGYTNIKVMRSGITGWAGAGYRLVADDSFVLKGGAVVVDLRPASRDTVERIPGSISIPFESFGKRLAEIPRRAPVIVYSDNIQQTITALGMLRTAGFHTPSMVDGNFQGWKKRNQPLSSGPVVSKIQWNKKQLKGEVSSATFTNAVLKKSDVLILDVRTEAETSAGRIRGARTIPLNALYEHMAELPKDKAIYIYSATGARAEMAARLLRQNGYRAFFLAADINCSGGSCTIVR